MLCPHCQEYDIENEIEIDPIYTEAEHTKIAELKEELNDVYTLLGETSQELHLLKRNLNEYNKTSG